MINNAFFISAPLDFKQKCLIYPPTIKDVTANSQFNQYLHLLTTSQEDLSDEFLPHLKEGQHVPTPLEFLLANCYTNKDFANLTKQAFLLFTHQEVSFFYEQKTIVFGNIEKLLAEFHSLDTLVYLTEDDFFDFQNLIRQSVGENPIKPPEPIDKDEDPRIRRIKEKARQRDRIKAKKGTKDGISLTTCLVAICCMGIGITPLNIGEMSYCALNAIIKVYQEKEKYDIDIRSLLAGASSKKIHPKYWIRNLTD